MYDKRNPEHPWFKHYRASHDPLEPWLEVEREILISKIARDAQKEKVHQKRKKCETDA